MHQFLPPPDFPVTHFGGFRENSGEQKENSGKFQELSGIHLGFLFAWRFMGIQWWFLENLGAMPGFAGKSGIGLVWGDLGSSEALAQIDRHSPTNGQPASVA